ncbi:MAG: hypothetical protein ACT4PV_14000, partial [Planctomycetaceae bacterium]
DVAEPGLQLVDAPEKPCDQGVVDRHNRIGRLGPERFVPRERLPDPWPGWPPAGPGEWPGEPEVPEPGTVFDEERLRLAIDSWEKAGLLFPPSWEFPDPEEIPPWGGPDRRPLPLPPWGERDGERFNRELSAREFLREFWKGLYGLARGPGGLLEHIGGGGGGDNSGGGGWEWRVQAGIDDGKITFKLSLSGDF